MSLIPLVFNNDVLDLYRPRYYYDDDYFFSPRDVSRELRRLAKIEDHLRRQLTSVPDVGAQVQFDKDKFQVNVDVQQFSPNEITVKTSGDNTITVEGKHEERPDEHGYVSRHFVRRYVLPKGHDISQVQSNLSSDGVLTITAPKVDALESGQRNVPIQQTGRPSKAVENKSNK